MATHFSILAWEIPWRGESGRLVHGMQRVRLDLVTKEQQKTITAGEVYCLNNTTDWWLQMIGIRILIAELSSKELGRGIVVLQQCFSLVKMLSLFNTYCTLTMCLGVQRHLGVIGRKVSRARWVSRTLGLSKGQDSNIQGNRAKTGHQSRNSFISGHLGPWDRQSCDSGVILAFCVALPFCQCDGSRSCRVSFVTKVVATVAVSQFK